MFHVSVCCAPRSCPPPVGASGPCRAVPQALEEGVVGSPWTPRHVPACSCARFLFVLSPFSITAGFGICAWLSPSAFAVVTGMLLAWCYSVIGSHYRIR